MTVFAGPVFNWASSGLNWDAPPYESDSPNMVALEAGLREAFGGCNMGIHLDRPRPSGSISEHAYGSALDHGTGAKQIDWAISVNRPVGPVLTRDQHVAMIDWIVAHSKELHVQSIVDIGRSWRAGRGWINYDSGYTGHAHIVTTLDGWDDDTPIFQRSGVSRPNVPPPDYWRLPLDLIDLSRFNSITKYADVPDVPIIHQTQILHGVTNITVDDKFHPRMSYYNDRRDILGGYIPLVGGTKWPIIDQMTFHFDQMDRYWRDGWFTRFDIESWEGKYPLVTIDELSLALNMHAEYYGPGRRTVYMNPNVDPKLWAQFIERHPNEARCIPDYSPDGDEQARRHGATIHQWSSAIQPDGFSTAVDVNQVIDWTRLRQVAGLEQPPVVVPPKPTPTPIPIPEPEPEEAMPVILIEPANRKGLFDLSGAPVSIEVYKVLVAVHGQPTRVTNVDKIPAGIGKATFIVVSQNHPYWDAYVDEQLGTQGRAMYAALGPRT